MYRKSVLTGDFEFAVNREFEAVERAFASFFDVHRLQKLYAEPSPRFDGMIAFADGTTWNPGSGEGVYRYDASSATWISFESSGADSIESTWGRYQLYASARGGDDFGGTVNFTIGGISNTFTAPSATSGIASLPRLRLVTNTTGGTAFVQYPGVGTSGSKAPFALAHGIRAQFRFGFETGDFASGCGVYAGFLGSASALDAISQSPSGDANPGWYVGVGKDASDTTWQIMTRDTLGGTAATKYNTSVTIADNTIYYLRIFSAPNSGEVTFTFGTWSAASGYTSLYTTDVSTDLPAATNAIAPQILVCGQNGVTCGISAIDLYALIN